MSSTIISIQNSRLIWFYVQRIHMELVTVLMFHLPWAGTTTQENFWNLEIFVWLAIKSETSIQKFQQYSNWFSVVWVRLIGNGEKIWTISIDCNIWEIFFMMDTLTRPGLHGSIWLANDWFSQPEAKNSAKSCIGCRFWQKPETLWNLEITIRTLGQIL